MAGKKTVWGLVALATLAAGQANAQKTRRPRRESNANRKARIARTIDKTYGYRWEVGGGGGFLRFRPGQYKQQNNEVSFWASALYGLTPKLGVVGLGGGSFGSAKLGNTPQNAQNPQIQQYIFMGGPSYRVLRRQRYGVSVFGAGGAAYGNFGSGSKDYPPQTVGLFPSEIRPAFAVGANVDFNLYPNFAVRVTPMYLGTTFGGTLENNRGVNAGVVYRFGGK